MLEPYQRRTARLTGQVSIGGARTGWTRRRRLLAQLAIGLSRHTAARVLLGIPVPERPVPAAMSADDFGCGAATATARW